jgi:hypothetical protein
MSDNDIQLKDYSSTPKTFNPDMRDVGGNVRRNRVTNADAATYTETFNSALGTGWTKVATCNINTLALRIGFPAASTVFDVEWTVVAAGASAPTATNGDCLLAGGFFDVIPIGDIYLRSASSQIAVVKTAA